MDSYELAKAALKIINRFSVWTPRVERVAVARAARLAGLPVARGWYRQGRGLFSLTFAYIAELRRGGCYRWNL